MDLILLHPHIFVNNKYLNWYTKLITHRLNESAVEGEYHHYVPKSLHKNDDLVLLSHREHYVAHLLLTKCIQPQYRPKMLYALTAMKMKTLTQSNFNSRLFEQLKNQANLSRSSSMKGHAVTEETREKLRTANLGKKASAETRLKMSNARKGRKNTKEHVEKTASWHRGRKRSPETIQRLKDERATRVRITCPHCGKQAFPGNYHRWHGDKCKLISRPDDL